MKTSEYIKKYPEKEYLWKLPKVDDPSGIYHYDKSRNRYKIERGVMLKCEDPDCSNPDAEHFVVLSNLVKDKFGDGVYRCKSCGIRLSINKRGPESKASAGYKSHLTRKNKGYYTSDSFVDSQKRAYSTNVENDTFMKEHELPQIISKYGGYHLCCKTCYPGTDVAFAYEADWIDMDRMKIIEIDTPDHVMKEQGYHHKKREYFESKGFRVLNIAVNRKQNKISHPRRPGYTYTELIEEFVNGNLPREYEIMWDDPWYVNG